MTRRVVVIGPSGEPRGGVSKYVDDVLALLEQAGVDHVHLQSGAGVPWVGRRTRHWVAAARRKAGLYARVATRRPGAPEVVHVHLGFHYPRADALMCRLLVARGFDRVAVTLHGGRDEEWQGLLQRRDVVGALSRVEAVHVQTRAMERVFADSPVAGRTVYAPMAILRRAEAGVARGPDEPLRVVYVGLMTPTKGVSVLLAAAQRLVAGGVAVEVTLIGGCDRHYEQAFEAARAPLGDRCRYLGRQPERVVFAELARAHVFGMPTSWPGEGTPLSVIEALSFSLPVVATRWRGLADLVAHDETGLLVDDPDDGRIAEALEALVRDEPRRQALGRAAGERFDALYSQDALARCLSTLYDMPSEAFELNPPGDGDAPPGDTPG